MAETRRKLTTILSADVQDYTRLMGADEEGTLSLLKQYRDAMARLIVSHGGRVVNTWGDGLIAEFPSVVEAVRAAVDTQNELAVRNESQSPSRRMLFRIGINLGDVIADGDDIYGDGVNIAARLQTQAQPGGIVISNTVYDQVRNKVPVGFDFLGALAVKNVDEAIPSYAVRVGSVSPEPEPASAPSTAARPSRPAPSDAPEPTTASASFAPHGRRIYGVLAIAAAIVTVVNAATWGGAFWAKWPLLTFGAIAVLAWASARGGSVARMAWPIVAIAVVVLVNLFTWDGGLWAHWPVIGIAAAVAVRRVMRSGARTE